MDMGFEKGHVFYKGAEKGWFRKGQTAVNKGKKLKKDNLCIKCRKFPTLLNSGSYCRECTNERQRIWRNKNRERSRLSAKIQGQNVRKKVFLYYGNKCICCGETCYEFLSIDHINNDGALHRKEIGIGRNIYYWLIKNGFPKNYQILCFNCNLAKAHWGLCPHQKLKMVTKF